MKQQATVKDSIVQQMMQDNEVRTNRNAAVFLSLFILYPYLNMILLKMDYSPSFSRVNQEILIPLSVLVGLVLMVCYFFHFQGAWVKHVLLGTLLFFCNLYYVFFPAYASYLLIVPLYVAVRYYNRRLLYIVAALNIGIFLLTTTIGTVLDGQNEIVHAWHETAYYNPWPYSIDITSFIVFPILFTSLFFAFYAIDISKSGHRFIRKSADHLRQISAIETEYAMAARVQSDALPPKSYEVPGGEFSILASEEAARVVGGDFYDYFLLRDDLLMVLIADVSDKGFPAAMFMMSAKKALRSALRCCTSLEEAIELANRLMCEDNQGGMFLTLWLGLVDIHSGVCRFVNAGHLPPFLRHADGSVESIQNDPDLFIGCFPEQVPTVHSFRFRKGDVLVLYTDGMTDSMNPAGEHFGEERLESTLQKAGGDAQSLCEAAISASKNFAENAEQFDDMTMMFLECKHMEEPMTVSFMAPADLEGVGKLQDGLQGFLHDHPIPDGARQNIGVITDEICCNIADYAYPEGNGSMEMKVSYASRCCDLEFVDRGVPFNPLEHETVLPPDPQIGGYGIYLVRQLSECMSYERKENRNILHVRVLWNF